jgi:hypothetical protein
MTADTCSVCAALNEALAIIERDAEQLRSWGIPDMKAEAFARRVRRARRAGVGA